MRTAPLALAFVLVAGCSLIADPAKIKPDVPATVDGFCAALRQRITTWEARCMGEAPAWRQQAAGWPECSDWSRAVAVRTAVYDRSLAYDCLLETRWATCFDWFAHFATGYPLACQSAVQGTIPVGPSGSCHADVECGPYAYCDSTAATCPSMCVDFAQDLADCSSTRCYPGRNCAPPAANPGGTPICHPVNLLYGAGTPCGAAGELCDYDLYCKPGTVPALACAPRAASGACAAGVECTRDSVCTQNPASRVCQPAKAVGATCTGGYQECVAGASCDGATGASGQCTLFPAGGGSCGLAANAEPVGCTGAVCLGGACVAAPGCPVP